MADHYKTLAKGAFIIFFGTIFSKLINYLYRIIIARSLGVESYGVFALCFTFTLFVGSIAIAGATSALERYIPIYKNDESKIKGLINFILKYSLTLSLLTTSLVIVFSKDIAILFGNPSLNVPLIMFSFSIPVVALLNLMFSFVKPFNKMIIPTISFFIILPSFNVLLSLLAIFMGFGLNGVILTYAISNLISSVVIIIYTQKNLFKLKSMIKSSVNIKEILHYIFPLMVTSMMLIIIANTDILILGLFQNEKNVGFYSAATLIATLLIIFPTLLFTVLLPVLSELMSNNNIKEIINTLKKVCYWSAIFNVPMLMLFITSGNTILKLLFGSEFVPARLPLLILSIGYFMYIFFLPLTKMYELYKDNKSFMILTIICAFICICSNLILAKNYNLIGSAIATTSTLYIITTVLIIKFYISHKIHPFSWSLVKIVLANILIFVPLYALYKLLLTPNIINFIMISFLFGMIYSLVLYKYILNDVDKELLYAALRRVKLIKQH